MRYRDRAMTSPPPNSPTARGVRRDECHPARALLHPLWWIALVLWVVNDHWLKGRGLLPGAVTGKLSDLAGLIVAPVLLAALLDARRRSSAVACFAVVAAWFVAINTSAGAAAAWEQLAAAVALPWHGTCDPTDLLALPAIVLGWWLIGWTATPVADEPWPTWRRTARSGAMVIGALACMATSRPLPPPTTTLSDHVLAQAWSSAPLLVIQKDSGQVVGKLDTPGWIGPAVQAGDVLYTLRWRGLTATEIPSGRLRFDHELRTGRFQPTLATDDRRLFVVTAPRHRLDPEHLVALDGQRPQRLWQRPLPSQRRWRSRAHGLVVQNGLLLVPAANRLLAIDPVTGAVLWTHQAKAELSWPLALATNVYATGADGTLVALDTETGDLLWRIDTGQEQSFALRPWRACPLGGDPAGPLLYADGSSLVAVDPHTGAPRWRQRDVQDAVLGAGAVFAKVGDGHYAVFDSVDGHQRWRLEMDGLASSRPVVDGASGAVYLRPQGGLLHAYDLGTGAVRWSVDLQDAVTVVDVAAGRVLVGPWAR